MSLDADETLKSNLKSEIFSLREAAESALVEQARSSDAGVSKRQLLDFYFGSHDPEVRFRLIDILFETFAAEIPRSGNGALGISMDNGMPNNWVAPSLLNGVVILATIKNSPAEKAGLQRGDLILAVNGISVEGDQPVRKITRIISGNPPGSVILLKILRGGSLLFLEVPLMSKAAMPAQQSFNFPRELEANLEIDRKELRKDFRVWLRSQRPSTQ